MGVSYQQLKAFLDWEGFLAENNANLLSGLAMPFYLTDDTNPSVRFFTDKNEADTTVQKWYGRSKAFVTFQYALCMERELLEDRGITRSDELIKKLREQLLMTDYSDIVFSVKGDGLTAVERSAYNQGAEKALQEFILFVKRLDDSPDVNFVDCLKWVYRDKQGNKKPGDASLLSYENVIDLCEHWEESRENQIAFSYLFEETDGTCKKRLSSSVPRLYHPKYSGYIQIDIVVGKSRRSDAKYELVCNFNYFEFPKKGHSKDSARICGIEYLLEEKVEWLSKDTMELREFIEEHLQMFYYDFNKKLPRLLKENSADMTAVTVQDMSSGELFHFDDADDLKELLFGDE